MTSDLWVVVFHINISSINVEASSSRLCDCCGPDVPSQQTGQASNLASPQWPIHPPHVTGLPLPCLFVRFLAKILLKVNNKDRCHISCDALRLSGLSWI